MRVEVDGVSVITQGRSGFPLRLVKKKKEDDCRGID
jgi:hypothetical protein